MEIISRKTVRLASNNFIQNDIKYTLLGCFEISLIVLCNYSKSLSFRLVISYSFEGQETIGCDVNMSELNRKQWLVTKEDSEPNR